MQFHFPKQIVPSDKLCSYQPANAFEQLVKDFALDWLTGKPEFYFQTSGSTGQPKKITFTRQQMQASARLTQQTFDLQNEQAALLCLDPVFVASKMMIVRAMEIGMDLIVVEPSANPLQNLSIERQIAFAAFVPYQLNSIIQNPTTAKKLGFISKAIIGGAASNAELVEKLQGLPTMFYETYGMTETLTHVAIRRLNPPEDAFQILPGIKFFLDARLCLSIQAQHLGSEIIATNDLIEFVDDTHFRLNGRYDNVINTAGMKVLPEHLERRIATIMDEDFKGCAYFITGIKDKAFGEKLVLIVEVQTIPASTKNHVFSLLKQHFRNFEIPKEIIAIPAFKRTDSGKVNRMETIRLANL
jgi:o-succinylbenzoate---CoA ligase